MDKLQFLVLIYFNTLKDWLCELKTEILRVLAVLTIDIWWQGHCVEVWPYEMDVYKGKGGLAKVDMGE